MCYEFLKTSSIYLLLLSKLASPAGILSFFPFMALQRSAMLLLWRERFSLKHRCPLNKSNPGNKEGLGDSTVGPVEFCPRPRSDTPPHAARGPTILSIKAHHQIKHHRNKRMALARSIVLRGTEKCIFFQRTSHQKHFYF